MVHSIGSSLHGEQESPRGVLVEGRVAIDSLFSMGGNNSEDRCLKVSVQEEVSSEQTEQHDAEYCIVEPPSFELASSRPPFDVMLLVDTNPCSGRRDCERPEDSHEIDDLVLRVVDAKRAPDGVRILVARDVRNPESIVCRIRFDSQINRGHLSFVGRP